MTPEEEELSPEIYQLLASDRKIEAIKLIREETGLGLREAKDLADALSGNHDPGQVPPPEMREEGGAGGMVAILIAILIAILVYVFFLSH
ncbi:MAG: ribosomal protein L7/L12 [Woeseia sp.]